MDRMMHAACMHAIGELHADCKVENPKMLCSADAPTKSVQHRKDAVECTERHHLPKRVVSVVPGTRDLFRL